MTRIHVDATESTGDGTKENPYGADQLRVAVEHAKTALGAEPVELVLNGTFDARHHDGLEFQNFDQKLIISGEATISGLMPHDVWEEQEYPWETAFALNWIEKRGADPEMFSRVESSNFGVYHLPRLLTLRNMSDFEVSIDVIFENANTQWDTGHAAVLIDSSKGKFSGDVGYCVGNGLFHNRSEIRFDSTFATCGWDGIRGYASVISGDIRTRNNNFRIRTFETNGWDKSGNKHHQCGWVDLHWASFGDNDHALWLDKLNRGKLNLTINGATRIGVYVEATPGDLDLSGSITGCGLYGLQLADVGNLNLHDLKVTDNATDIHVTGASADRWCVDRTHPFEISEGVDLDAPSDSNGNASFAYVVEDYVENTYGDDADWRVHFSEAAQKYELQIANTTFNHRWSDIECDSCTFKMTGEEADSFLETSEFDEGVMKTLLKDYITQKPCAIQVRVERGMSVEVVEI